MLSDDGVDVEVIVPRWAECPVCGCELVGLPESDADSDDLCHQCRTRKQAALAAPTKEITR